MWERLGEEEWEEEGGRGSHKNVNAPRLLFLGPLQRRRRDSQRETMLTTFPSVRSSRAADCPSERALGGPARQPGGHMMALVVIPTRFSHFLISLSYDLLLAQSFAGSWLLVLRKCEMCANYDIMICLLHANRHSYL